LLLMPAVLLAGGSAAWESNSYADFVKGRFQGVSLTRDGRLTLAPRLDEIFTSGEAGIFSAAAAPDGTVYLGTGHRGRVYRVRPGQQAEVYWSAPHPGVFALALDAKGALYAAASPNGKIWKIENGQAREYFDPAGSLRVGARRRLRRPCVRRHRRQWPHLSRAPGGQGELWYETGQSHVTSLAFDTQGSLLAGTEPNGICTASRQRTAPSSSTIRPCPRSAPFCPHPMAPSMSPPSVVRWPASRPKGAQAAPAATAPRAWSPPRLP
jgi:hypothetical protein